MFRILWSVALVGIVTCGTLYFEPKDTSKGVVCPDKQSRCPAKSTCCLLPSGQYGCCPFDKAVCCSDRLHCCPEGATCDTPHKRCNQNGVLIPWFEKTRSTPVAPTVSVLVCPDQVSSCPTYAICCPLQQGFGCCPIRKGVCCSDGQHCCPQGHSCNLQRATCTKKDSPGIAWQSIVKTSSLKVQSQMKAGQASSSQPSTKTKGPPPKVSQSSSSGPKVTGQTVSKSILQDKRTVTAPGKQAPPVKAQQQKPPVVQKSQQLQQKSQPVPQTPPQKAPAKLQQATQTKAPPTPQKIQTPPAKQKQATQSKQAAIPPKPVTPKQPTQHSKQAPKPPQAKQQTQVKAQQSQKLQQTKPPQKQPVQHAKQAEQKLKVSQQKAQEQPRAKVVPQQQKTQQTAKQAPPPAKQPAKAPPKQNTPAQGAANVAQQASKGKAPNKDVKAKPEEKNENGGIMAKMVSKVKRFLKRTLIADDTDDLHKPTKPKEKAVASSKVPSKSKTQEKKSESAIKPPTKQAKQNPPKSKQAGGQAKNVPGKQPVQTAGSVKAKIPSQSQTKSTQAVHSKQAPKVNQAQKQTQTKSTSRNTIAKPKSNPGKGNPNPGQKHADAIKQKPLSPSRSTQQKPQGGRNVEVICRDKSKCPPGTTCCKMPSGAYGCCPMPSAICCTDGVHCCPQGYQCDGGKGQCLKTGAHILNVIQMLPPSETQYERLKASEVPIKKSAIKSGASKICPDQRSMCPSDATCCQMPTGVYGCCPIEKATCCPDRQHCCPEGYTCDTEKHKCTKQHLSVSWSKKEPAKEANFKPGAVICPDKKSQCDDGSTCCKLKSGDWGCCPLPKAVCCSDGLHCCPEGSRCTSFGVCARTEPNRYDTPDSIAWFKKVPASAVGSILCPGKVTRCPDESTCCKLSIGGYGCCPLPKAVCCSDGLHCCPNGYTCNSQKGTCTKGNLEALKTSNLFIRKGTKDGH